jgi:hypothetical protein
MNKQIITAGFATISSLNHCFCNANASNPANTNAAIKKVIMETLLHYRTTRRFAEKT